MQKKRWQRVSRLYLSATGRRKLLGPLYTRIKGYEGMNTTDTVDRFVKKCHLAQKEAAWTIPQRI